MKTLLHILILISFCCTEAQNTVQIHFTPLFAGSNLILQKKYNSQKDTVSISKLKFYLTDITFLKNNQTVALANKKHHLIDLEEPATLAIQQVVESEFDAIKFTVGVDSITQNSGVQEGDLDPIHGMYWTWQSGYIHFKIEGTSSRCKASKNKFQLHLGGYQAPFNTISEVYLPVRNKNSIAITIEVDKLLEQIDVSKHYQVMSPGQIAVTIAQIAASAFIIN